MARSVKFKAFTANAMKKAQVIGSKGAKYMKDQLHHPAASRFAMDAVKIGAGAVASGKPESAIPMLAMRAAKEGGDIVDRTTHHMER